MWSQTLSSRDGKSDCYRIKSDFGYSQLHYNLHLCAEQRSTIYPSTVYLMFALSICLFLSGEMAKQMKVKKLKNLKTLDSKPGKYFILLIILSCEVPYKTAAHSRTQIYVYEGADFPPEGAVQSLSCVFLHLCIVCVCCRCVHCIQAVFEQR